MTKPKKNSSESIEAYNERVSKLYYNEGYHIKEIAKKLKIDEVEVYNYVASGKRFTTSEEREEMISLYNKGYSIYSIAKKFNRSRACVRKRIGSRAKISCAINNSGITDKKIKKMNDMFNEGFTIEEISKEIGISTSSIIYRLSHSGNRTPNTHVTKSEINKFIKLFKSGKTHAEIAGICGRGTTTVSRHLHVAGYWRRKKDK